MTWIVLTNASSGATRNSGTNGDLCTLLDWALPQAGWAIEYTAANARVYRAASGNRLRVNVRHDSAISGAAQRCFVRGCESASSATAITDPFPLASQVVDANSNWLVSTTASTVDRPFIICLNETFFYYFSQVGSVANEWSMGFFGDAPAEYSGDSWNTVCAVRANASNTAVSTNGIGQPTSCGFTVGPTGQIFFARDVTGAIKSSQSSIGGFSSTSVAMGQLTAGNAARAGYQNKIYRTHVGVNDYASITGTASTLALISRAWLPNLWQPLHLGRGAVSDVDTFTDTAYNPAASFRMLSCNGATTTGPCCIIEETDTWVAP
ncbi:hypothetical protein SAMN05216569_1050 [Pseudoxanthomonas sp. CF125]|nr:hypothetical protein SAMN05216569_1050 [Pseudoxanthomonas sp. CF125]